MIIYIIHPFMIVVIRLFAKLLHLQSLLVENSLVHYIAVCFASVVFAVVITALLSRLKPKKAKHTADTDRAYLEIKQYLCKDGDPVCSEIAGGEIAEIRGRAV